MKTIKVSLDGKRSASYEIRIGADILDRTTLLVAKKCPAGLCVVLTDDRVKPLYGNAFCDALGQAGLNVVTVVIPAGESSKNISTVMDVVGRLLAAGADRETLLIALGGGVIGDLTGFIASVFIRSIPYVQIPTTLIGQVDSSIGGKTAVDLPQGKNLLGTFYQPRAVFADIRFLDTLPEKEFNNGLAEIIKYGAIEDEGLFKTLEDGMEKLKNKDARLLIKTVETCCRIKKNIVEMDEHEQGLRRILNFGHTVGHALEAVSGYSLSHGEGVGLGMVAAARISVKLRELNASAAERIEKLVAKAGLPTRLDSSVDISAVTDRLKMDKKKKGDVVRFVLLKKIGMPFVTGSVGESMIIEVLKGMRA